jgi:hypothetical protein
MLYIKVILTWLCFLQQFSSAMSKELVDTDLHLESWISVFLEYWKICFRDEGYLFVGGFSTEYIAERNVLEPFNLSDIVIVRLFRS